MLELLLTQVYTYIIEYIVNILSVPTDSRFHMQYNVILLKYTIKCATVIEILYINLGYTIYK